MDRKREGGRTCLSDIQLQLAKNGVLLSTENSMHHLNKIAAQMGDKWGMMNGEDETDVRCSEGMCKSGSP